MPYFDKDLKETEVQSESAVYYTFTANCCKLVSAKCLCGNWAGNHHSTHPHKLGLAYSGKCPAYIPAYHYDDGINCSKYLIGACKCGKPANIHIAGHPHLLWQDDKNNPICTGFSPMNKNEKQLEYYSFVEFKHNLNNCHCGGVSAYCVLCGKHAETHGGKHPHACKPSKDGPPYFTPLYHKASQHCDQLINGLCKCGEKDGVHYCQHPHICPDTNCEGFELDVTTFENMKNGLDIINGIGVDMAKTGTKVVQTCICTHAKVNHKAKKCLHPGCGCESYIFKSKVAMQEPIKLTPKMIQQLEGMIASEIGDAKPSPHVKMHSLDEATLSKVVTAIIFKVKENPNISKTVIKTLIKDNLWFTCLNPTGPEIKSPVEAK